MHTMPRITAFLLLLMMVIATSAQDFDRAAIKTAVHKQLATYPKSQLQDVYKAFYQEHFGPEHIITDTEAARNYLDQELASMNDKRQGGIYFEPIGIEGNYVRVYLIAVTHKLISRGQLLQAFIESANEHEPPTADWAAKWQAIVEVVDEVKPELGSDEERSMLQQASLSNQAVHHSPAYNAAYHPHYRIIKREIVEQLKHPQIGR